MRIIKSVYKVSKKKPLKNKKPIILFDEDIFIDKLEMQVSDKNQMLEIVQEHLIELFTDISDIVFHMEKIKINKKAWILLYCIRCNDRDLIQSVSKGKTKLIPIQFYFHKKYKNKLNKDNCIMIFENGDSLYTNFTKDRKIFDSSILREYKKGISNKRLLEIKDYIEDKRNIFFINKDKKVLKWNFHEFYSNLNINTIEV